MFSAQATKNLQGSTGVSIFGRLVVSGLTDLRDSISVYIGTSPKREKEGGGEKKNNDGQEKKISKQSPPAPTKRTVGSVLRLSKLVGHPVLKDT